MGREPAGLGEQPVAEAERFHAAGISVIVHPRNPHAPAFHANLRHFVTDSSSWFGGGLDLTPCYLYPEDARHFHRVVFDACARHSVADHVAWKQACDDYFRLPHRGEARGVGGIFFDHLTEAPAEVWAFQRDLGDHLADAYVPILERRMGTPYGPEEEVWQLRRRGRYAEFNLVWDRGTRFGLETGGRTESVLASLPPRVAVGPRDGDHTGERRGRAPRRCSPGPHGTGSPEFGVAWRSLPTGCRAGAW